MKKHFSRRVLALLLTILMVFSNLPGSVAKAEGETTTVTLSKYSTAPVDGDKVAIVYTAGNLALTETANGSKLNGEAVTVTDDTITKTDTMAYLDVTVSDGVYTFAANGKYLTSGATGNSLSFADAQGDYSKWTLEQQTDGTWYIINANAVYNGTKQALEYYNGFTTYGVKSNNAAYKFDFYGENAQTTPEEPTEPEEPGTTISTIAEALAGANGTEFTVKGVVTLVDGKNIYIQDATGGICLYFNTAPNNISLGDTVIGNGKRATYNDLPELSGATAELVTEAADKISLTAKDTSIGRLTTADVCTYVSMKDLEVTEVSGSNITVMDHDGAKIQIYKAVLGSNSLAVGDSLDFTGAVGIFKTTLQLRNTVADEITVKSEEETQTGLVKDLSQLTDGATVVIYNSENKKAIGSTTTRDWYLSAEDVTIEGEKAIDPAETVVWTVGVQTDETGKSVYSFSQGDKKISMWLSGTYVEITNNPAYNDATSSSYQLSECNKDNSSYYISSDDLTTNYGNCYLEIYSKKVDGVTALYTCGYSTSADKLTEAAYGFQFYLVEASEEEPTEPIDKGDLVTSLDQLDGSDVVIYSQSHMTAVSSKPNGDWYLKADSATVENGKVTEFLKDWVWTVTKNADGTYSFKNAFDETRSITVWPSGNYAELSVDAAKYPDNTWTLTPAKTPDCFYMNSPTVSGANGPAYVEAYVRNGTEVFSGYFTSPTNNRFTETEFALQFYLVDKDKAIDAIDDGEWDKVLEPGKSYVAYNVAAEASIGLYKEANYACDAIPTTIEGDKAKAGNGAYYFKVDSMGRYYTFEVDGKYLATNNDEELFFVEPNEAGAAPENAKWFLTKNGDSYIIYNKDAQYGGTPVCIEYFSSVFSGWTFNTKNDVRIYQFNFYEVVDGTKVYKNTVQDPSVNFDCEDSRYVEQDYAVAFTLDDLAEKVGNIAITFTAGDQTKTVTEYTASEDGKAYNFTIPAKDIDVAEGMESFTITVTVTNSYDITYTGEKVVKIIDEPFFDELTPAPNAQTGEDKRPAISAKVGNVGENPTFTMTLLIGERELEATPVFENGVLTYLPTEDIADGRVTVKITVTREDGVSAEKSWSFIVGNSEYQLYFGQLHSHTTYSDGSGTLETALDYIAALPESANVQFVAFTDHSNYFDTTSAANPADAVNDKSLMTDASRALWEKYKSTVADFNSKHSDLLAIAGFEMTWSGGPGHINTFDSDGLVSRNNADLNNKTGDAGMKLYYETINKGDSLNQFNHPGSTFGTFTDFSYWDEETDDHMFLVEVGNGEGQIGAGGYYPSYEQYIVALDKGWHVAPTNNQDNHKGRWGNANDARDVILTDNFSEQGIYDAIRALRLYATEDKNLQITYTVNGEQMGTIFGDEKPEKLAIEVTLYDPDATDSATKVEVVADGGKVVYTWDDAAELAEGALSAELAPDDTYYFIRVTQKDGDLAVTSPVWVGSGVSAGIQDFTSEDETVLVNQPTTLKTTLYNNQTEAATVKSLVYTIDGSTVVGTDTKGYTIPANGTVEVGFAYTPDTAKRQTITVTAVVEIEGKEHTYTKDLVLSVRETEGDLPITPIDTVRNQKEEGFEYAIEGIVTSNASGYDKDTAFFDCIYVQDETGGICCFPVSGEFKIGDKVHVEGYTDFYQGEPELQVESIEVIGSGSVDPTEVTAKQINDLDKLGSLVTLNGTVESVEEANGLIQTIMVKDEEGNIARVFIDGYITTGKEVENCEVGAKITATGLSSYDDTWPETDYFARIRIRDRADIICTIEEEPTPEEPTPEEPTTEDVVLTLDANGSTVDPATVTLGEDGKVTELPTPADRDGYIFGGWYDAKSGGNEVKEGDTLSESATLYAHWFRLRIVLTENPEVPEALKEQYKSVDDMEAAMLKLAEKKLGKSAGHELYEMSVEYNDGSKWLPLPAEMFPEKGVEVSMTRPKGSTAKSKFAVVHLFAEDVNGFKAGDTEQPNVTTSGSKLTFTVKGTSPLLVAWATTTSSTSKTGKTVKTGDDANLGLWLSLMAISGTACAAYFVTERKRKKAAR
ncbi:MAG: CehA/McbA family metallohydrolase [Lachnospiraceae bacterium]|nr:CehA/McbA family metallohydrolase [Lachnospiraceae bacterium]